MKRDILAVIFLLFVLTGLIFLFRSLGISRRDECKANGGTWVAQQTFDKSYCIEGPINVAIPGK